MSQTISANKIATGDVVILNRAGVLTVKRLRSFFKDSVTFSFSDGKTRRFEATKNLTVTELCTAAPVAGVGEIYRKDLASGRVSVVSGASFLYDFADVHDSFSANRGRIQSFNQTAALAELEKGVHLFTNARGVSAEYWIDLNYSAG